MPSSEVNSLNLVEFSMPWKFDRYICIKIVLLIATHGDPNPEAIQIFAHLEAGIRIAVIGFFIQSGALYKDHPALLLPSSKRLRQPCIVHNYRLYIIHIYVQLYTHTYNYIHIYTYTFLHTHHKYEHIVPFLRGHPQKLNISQ